MAISFLRRRTTAMPLSPEMELAIACCSWPLRPQRVERLPQVTRARLDWALFCRIVEQHEIAGLVNSSLVASRADLPGEVVEPIASAARVNAQDSLRLALEASRLQSELQQAGVEPVFLKGAALAVRLFGNLGLRMAHDIDVLVPPAKLEESLRVLTRLGYRQIEPRADLAASQIDFILARRKDVKLVHPESGIPVELHWRPFLNRHAMSIDALSTQVVQLGAGRSLRTLGEGELLAYLCVHGASHWWFRLKWLADVGALVAQTSAAALEGLILKAEQLGAGRPVAQAMMLCEDVLGTPIPPEVSRRARRRLGLQFANATVRRGWALDSGAGDPHRAAFGTTRGSLSTVLLGSGWRYYGRELANQLFSETDVVALPLPRGLRFLYPVMRLPRWIWRHILGGRASAAS